MAIRWALSALLIVVAACSQGGGNQSKQAVKQLDLAFTNTFAQCEEHFELRAIQSRGVVASWNVEVQATGFDPKVLPLEVSEQDAFRGVEFRGLVSFSGDFTARARSKKATDFGSRSRNASWSEWSDWKSAENIVAGDLTIENVNGNWNADEVVASAVENAAIAGFYRESDDLSSILPACNGRPIIRENAGASVKTIDTLTQSCMKDGQNLETCSCTAEFFVEEAEPQIIEMLLDASNAPDTDAAMISAMGELSPDEMTKFMSVAMKAASECPQ